MLKDLEADKVNFIFARCRTSLGYAVAVKVLDISVAGCLIRRAGLSIKPEDRVLITLPGLSSMPANVIWVEEESAGLAFEQHLYEPVLIHLQQAFKSRVKA